MNIFGDIFRAVVYQPELNILQFLYNTTGDIGISIILLAILVNLLLFPLYIGFYINSQKLRILQPKLKSIQKKYKKDQQQLVRKTMEFNKKHGINNGTLFYVLIGQILFVSGVWVLTNDVATGKTIEGLYSWLFPNMQVAEFSSQAFGWLPIDAAARDYIWMPILGAFFSFLYGMYVTKWSPNSGAPETTVQQDPNSPIDPAQMQKILQFQTIYLMPIILFVVNSSLTVGANIYSVTLSLIAILRQVALTTFYSNRAEQLLSDVIDSDPSVDQTHDEIDETDVVEAATAPVATKVAKKKKKTTSIKEKATKKKTVAKKKKKVVTKKKSTKK